MSFKKSKFFLWEIWLCQTYQTSFTLKQQKNSIKIVILISLLLFLLIFTALSNKSSADFEKPFKMFYLFQ